MAGKRRLAVKLQSKINKNYTINPMTINNTKNNKNNSKLKIIKKKIIINENGKKGRNRKNGFGKGV